VDCRELATGFNRVASRTRRLAWCSLAITRFSNWGSAKPRGFRLGARKLGQHLGWRFERWSEGEAMLEVTL
jgi:hypothetical protein